MREWSAERVAAAAGAQLLSQPAGEPATRGPSRACIDTRELNPGELFVGLRGEHVDGGAHAVPALRAGAWGVLVAPQHAAAALAVAGGGDGVVLAHPNPLLGLQTLARSWRRALGERGCKVLAITGSAGKTSTKDILAALLAKRMRTAATPANLNTEIGLPLVLLAAPADSEAVVLEMAMRGSGQIAELAQIAEPDVGVIVNIGEAHLELLGSIEAIAAAKAELIAGLTPPASAVVPAGERLLEPHLREDIETITFGAGGDVTLTAHDGDGRVQIRAGEHTIELELSFSQAHNMLNLLAAVGACVAIGYVPEGRLDVAFSALRGERLELPGGVVVIDDCYNANPMSMRAAIDDLAATARARRVAVLGDMLELGEQSPRLHREIGVHAHDRGVDVLIAVGPQARAIADAFSGESHTASDAPQAAELLGALIEDGDTVLVKGSRGVGLERVATALGARSAPNASTTAGAQLAPSAGGGQR